MPRTSNKFTPEHNQYLLPISILLAAAILASAWVYTTKLKLVRGPSSRVMPIEATADVAADDLEKKVLPSQGAVLPIRWGDLGLQLVRAGVIDRQKFISLYTSRGGLAAADLKLLDGTDNGGITITTENSGFLLNLFWALGLGNKNVILANGPMQDARYGGAGNFVSTGGWSLAVGDAMGHYDKHEMVVLTAEQQKLVEQVSRNIYRPCCDNATYFPDCNHGMAMLGLLQLMAAQSTNEEAMYKAALQVNAYWFPDTYLTIAQYLKSRGLDWQTASAKELLGAEYSSSSGYRRILSQVAAPVQKGGSGCGV